MRIGLFVVMAGRNAGGPETYEHALVRNLAALDKETDYRIFCFTEEAARSFDLDQANVDYTILGNRSRVLATAYGLPKALKSHNIDLMHATFVPPPVSPVDYVFTLHDSGMFLCPEFYPPLIRWRLKALVAQGLRQARHIFCVSENVANYAADYHKFPRERLSVTYNAVGAHFAPADAAVQANVLARYKIPQPYFIFAGRLEPRKNAVRLLEAFNIVRREVNPDLHLVLTGRKTWAGSAVDRTIARLGLGSHVIETGYVADADLPALYSGAEAFVFPSLWEGFGIPVVEAMACGTPVLTSNVSALPEIAGGAAILVDPLRIDDIAHGMERLAREPELRASLSAKGLRRAKDFSWAHTAELTRAAYARVLEVPLKKSARAPDPIVGTGLGKI
jgi:glycosyltransferase involved in cell wall biosynthesis